MDKNTSAAPQGAAPQAAGGKIDTRQIVNQARNGVPQQLRAGLDKVVVSGMRIMFSEGTHQMTLEQLDQPGPMAPKLAQGIVGLMYMLWDQSKQSIPPQLMVPATVLLTVKAFEFLQESQDPEATKETLGEALAQAVQGVLDGFGATQEKLPSLIKSQGKGTAPGAPAAPTGMLAKRQAGGMLNSKG